jgi:hypothetical protein
LYFGIIIVITLIKDNAMVQKLLVWVVIITLVISCKKEDTTEPVVAETGCNVISEIIDGKPYRNYEYTTDSLLFRIVQYERRGANQPQKRFSFDYGTEGKVKALRETNLMSPFVNYQYEMHYSNEGLVDTIRQFRIFNSGPKSEQIYVLVYDAKQRLTLYKWGENYWRYEYDDTKNVVKWFSKIVSITNTEQLMAEYGNYDGKRNFYFFSQPAMYVNLIGGGGMSDENPGSFKLYEGAQLLQTGVVTYKYNGKNLPTEASISAFPASGNAYTQVYKFTYNCL